MKTRNILLRFLNHLPNGNNEMKEEMKEIIQKKKHSLPHRAAMQMLLSAKAAHLIILIATLPLLATSCRDDEPSAGSGKLITVSRLHVSIDGMQSAAEMNAARSAQTGNGAQTHNSGDTRADAPTPDAKGYVGPVKKKFVPGDVLHFVVALTSDDLDYGTPQVCNATLQADGITWHFDRLLLLPQEAAKIYSLKAFYDSKQTPYDSYNQYNENDALVAYQNAKNGTLIASDGNSYSYPDLLYVYGEKNSYDDFRLNNGKITIGSNGTLDLTLEHNNSLVRISDINIQLGNAAVSSITANIAYGSSDAPDYYTVPLTAIGNGTSWGAIIGDAPGGTAFLESFIVSLDNDRTVSVSVPTGRPSFDFKGRRLEERKAYSYRLILLPGSVSAEEDGDTAPSYKVRRDAAVPAGYIPIYSPEDLRKIGSNDPAIVNGYLYTNASSAILAAEAQKDPIYDAITRAYTDSGHSQDATNAAIASGGIAPNAAPTSDGTNKVGHLTFSLDARYILMNDIDLTPTSVPVDKEFTNIDNVDQVELWKPIGTDQHPFTGRFHGNGFTIRGMTINSNAMEVGLFGFTRGAVIYNVHLQDARVKGMGINLGNLGSLVGNCQYSTISLCSATGCALKATEENAYVGGLVGLVESGTITRSYATACTLSGGDGLIAGGLVSYNKGTLASCYTAGCAASFTAGSNNSFGGLAGGNSAIIYGCYATYAQKSGTDTGNFGSLVGTNTSYGTIGSSYAINAASSTLGLVGNNDSGIITACVSPFETSSSSGASPGSDGKQDNGGGSYWKVIADASTPTKYTGGYAPLTNTDLLATLSNSSNPSFTSEGYLAEVRTLLVNARSTDIVKDMGGGEDNGITYGALDKIPPGGIYTEKIEWRARSIWGGSTAPESSTVVLPRINWKFNGEEN